MTGNDVGVPLSFGPTGNCPGATLPPGNAPGSFDPATAKGPAAAGAPDPLKGTWPPGYVPGAGTLLGGTGAGGYCPVPPAGCGYWAQGY